MQFYDTYITCIHGSKKLLFQIYWNDGMGINAFNKYDLNFLFKHNVQIKKYKMFPLYKGSNQIVFSSKEEATRFNDEMLIPAVMAHHLIHK